MRSKSERAEGGRVAPVGVDKFVDETPSPYTSISLPCGQVDLIDLGQDAWLETLKNRNSPHIEHLSLSLWSVLCAHAKTAVDVGAFNGMYSLAACLSNPKIVVIAFEPMPLTYGTLVLNLLLNSRSGQVRAVNAALSDTQGQTSIASRFGPYVMASGESMKQSTWTNTFVTETVVFDRIREAATSIQGWPPELLSLDPDVIKIDVEGFESNVVRGMKETILHNQETIQIIAECLDESSYASLLTELPAGACSRFIKEGEDANFELQSCTSFLGAGNYWINWTAPHQVADLAVLAMNLAQSSKTGLVTRTKHLQEERQS